MNNLLYFFVFAFVCGSLSALSVERTPNCPPGLIRDCIGNPDPKETVWATDAEQQICYTLKTYCHYSNFYCQTIKNGQAPPKETTKEECQKLCDNKCTLKTTGPVCAKIGDSYCTFADNCALQNYICKNGQVYDSVLDKYCEDQTNARECPKGQA